MNNNDAINYPWFVIIAGPNGAGKSTFHEKVIQEWDGFRDVQFVNMDNYAKYLAGDVEKVDQHMMQASRIVKGIIEDNLANRRSFVYETTASGLSHLKYMERAKENGYKVATIFIGLSCVELSHLRVQKRVQEGGHDVPQVVINRRYPNILKNLPEMLARSDIAAIFDNSYKNPFKLISISDRENIVFFFDYPKWLKKAFEGRKTSKSIIRAPKDMVQKVHDEKLAFAKKVFENNIKKVI